MNALRALLVAPALALAIPGLALDGDRRSGTTGPTLVVSARDGRLSVSARSVPLWEVLARVREVAPVDFVPRPAIGGDPVSLVFSDVPLEEGVRRLLVGRSYAMASPGPLAAGRPHIQVYVLGSTTGTPAPGPERARALESDDGGDALARLRRLTKRLRAFTGPEMHAAAAGRLSQRERLALEESALLALRAPQEEAREAALEVLEDSGIERLPGAGAGMVAGALISLVADMATADPSPELRVEALELLADVGADSDGEALKQAALHAAGSAVFDDDARVRAAALAVLEGLTLESLTPHVRRALTAQIVDHAAAVLAADAEADLRIDALELLADTESEQAVAPLLGAAAAEDPGVRSHASRLLDTLLAALEAGARRAPR